MNTLQTVLTGLALTLISYSCTVDNPAEEPVPTAEEQVPISENESFDSAAVDRLIEQYSTVPEVPYPSLSGKGERVTLEWDGDPTTFANTLNAAITAAGTDGVVFIPKGVYQTDREIIFPEISGVTIVGSGRDETIIEATQLKQTSGLLISRGDNMKFINFTVDWKQQEGNVACAINTNGFDDNQAFGMAFKNADIGFGTANNRTGLPINGLKAINCIFENCTRGMIFNRNFSAQQVRKIDQVQVISCEFKGNMRVGISIDCGNDGADGALIFRDLPFAEEAMGVVTDMDGMIIAGNTFEPALLFNIAIAKAKNINIFSNTIKGTTGAENFTENINIEHEASDILIAGNNIVNQGDFSSYMSILTFRDYGNDPLFENGARRINVYNNTFSGAAGTGIVGEEAGEVNIINNTFNAPLPTGFHVNFFTSGTGMGNRNIIVKNNTNTPEDKIRIQAGTFQ